MKAVDRIPNKVLAIVSALVSIALIVAVVGKVEARRRKRASALPIRPLVDLENTEAYPTPSEENNSHPTSTQQGDSIHSVELNNVPLTENVFSEKEEGVDKFQAECGLTYEPCTAFSAECCPGLVCIPFNETLSRCSHFKSSICINTGKICNDAVYGVECCDGGVCTSESGNTGRSRCVLPTVDTRTASSQETEPTVTHQRTTRSPSSRRLRRHLDG